MLTFSTLLALTAPALAGVPFAGAPQAEVPVECADIEIIVQDHAAAADAADRQVRFEEDNVRAHFWMYDNLKNLNRDHESLMEEREKMHQTIAMEGWSVELEEVLMLIGEIEADIWLNISRVEHQIAGLEFDRDRARERSDIAHDAYARVEDQLSRCIENAAPSPVVGR